MTPQVGRLHDSRRSRLRWAVIGGSGFIGSGIVEAARRSGAAQVRSEKAPRLLSATNSTANDILASLDISATVRRTIAELIPSLEGIDIVINAAGLAEPDAQDSPNLTGANALLPTVIAAAAQAAGVQRFVHLSSAAVQGRTRKLDESPRRAPFSAYSRSKALGEEVLQLWSNDCRARQANPRPRMLDVVIVRATSVQGDTRSTSHALKRVARSRLSGVASPGSQPSAVSSLEGLAEFVTLVGSYEGNIPGILIQPWEGSSARQVLELAGDGRTPVVIPRMLARMGVETLFAAARVIPRVRGLVRRLEVMWFGQDQVTGWAIETGLVARPVEGPSEALRRAFQENAADKPLDP